MSFEKITPSEKKQEMTRDANGIIESITKTRSGSFTLVKHNYKARAELERLLNEPSEDGKPKEKSPMKSKALKEILEFRKREEIAERKSIGMSKL